MKKFWGQVKKTKECWIWTGPKSRMGYGRFYHQGRLQQAHRVVWSFFTGFELPAQVQMCHTCDNPSCVRPSHLFPGSASDNKQDSIVKGRQKGVIQRRPRKKLTQTKLAVMMGCTRQNVRRILKRMKEV